MPVRFTVSKHGSSPVQASYHATPDAAQLLANTWGWEANTIRSKELLQTSLVNTDFSAIRGMSNGFVETVQLAYNNHHHLVLRPDDVWIAILAQFNFYVNAHGEELRHLFVAHEGKKELVIKTMGTRYTVDFGNIASQMTQCIHENVVDESLNSWILPNFSTTSHNDTVVCAVLMMATLKTYFNYTSVMWCGIPSVTLEGEKEDWENILSRLAKLKEFGPEPAAWAGLLRPILSRFVNAFDGKPDVKFWTKVCHQHSNGSGPTYLSGWITAFCVWSTKGIWQGPPLTGEKTPSDSMTEEIKQLVLDGVKYPIIDTNLVPTGFCDVDIKLNDNGEIFEGMMVSGHLAALVEGALKDTIRPLPAWFMFIKEEYEDPDLAETRKMMQKYSRSED